MKDYFKRLWLLFSTFFKIGAFTFGGGYAMISLIGKEVVDKRAWLEDSDILDIVAIAESTPGPIAINASTFVGYKVAGFWGAFFAENYKKTTSGFEFFGGFYGGERVFAFVSGDSDGARVVVGVGGGGAY